MPQPVATPATTHQTALMPGHAESVLMELANIDAQRTHSLLLNVEIHVTTAQIVRMQALAEFVLMEHASIDVLQT
jgi:hypothetical protein